MHNRESTYIDAAADPKYDAPIVLSSVISILKTAGDALAVDKSAEATSAGAGRSSSVVAQTLGERVYKCSLTVFGATRICPHADRIIEFTVVVKWDTVKNAPQMAMA